MITRPQPAAPPAEVDHSAEYIIYPILRRKEIMLISGSKRSGKTPLAVQMARDIETGSKVLGYPSYPASGVYATLAHSKGQVVEAAEAAGASSLRIMAFPVKRGQREKSVFESLCIQAKEENPDLEVLFVDGILRSLEKGSLIEYGPVADLMESIEECLEKYELTLVGIGCSAKPPKDSSHFSRAIDRFMGNSAWSERPRTVISIDHADPTDITNGHRVITIESRRIAPLTQRWHFNANGILVHTGTVIEDIETSLPPKCRELGMILDAYPDGSELKMESICEDAKSLNIPERSCERYVELLCNAGKLNKMRRGWYKTEQIQ
jgi:hypothetical protein